MLRVYALEEPSSAPRFADTGPVLAVFECLLKCSSRSAQGLPEEDVIQHNYEPLFSIKLSSLQSR